MRVFVCITFPQILDFIFIQRFYYIYVFKFVLFKANTVRSRDGPDMKFAGYPAAGLFYNVHIKISVIQFDTN